MADNTKNGVLIYHKDACWNGCTLFCNTCEFPEKTETGTAPIYLIDMEGRIVHRWEAATALQSHCKLLADGHIIYPTRDRSDIKRAGIRELDGESNIVWSYHCRIDHDFQLLEGGNLLLHTITDYAWPQLGKELKRHPRIMEITRDKELVWEWRGEEHVDEMLDLLDEQAVDFFRERVAEKFSFDWAHNNTCQVIPPNAAWDKEKEAGKEPVFKPGNIVFSYRSVDIIGVIERPSGKILWAWGPGVLDGQHKPHMLENGNILVFDNGTLRGWSRVIEVNPLTGGIEWEYTAEPKEDFFSPYISGAQRLPNGNTLICEGGKGRLFEVTPDKRIVWDFVNPNHASRTMKSIYRCRRYDEDYVKPLLS